MPRECKNKRLNPQQRELCNQHMGLVMKIAADYCRDRGLMRHLDDVRASAWMGLVDACWLFDPRRGVKFSSYLNHRVLGQIVEDIRRPTRAKCRKANVSSMEAMNDDDDGEHHDRFGFDSGHEKQIDDESEVAGLLRRFNARERFAYRMHHGHGHPMKQVGKMLGLSESRISQMLSNMQQRLEATHAD